MLVRACMDSRKRQIITGVLQTILLCTRVSTYYQIQPQKKCYYSICNCIILLAHVGQDGIGEHAETTSHEDNAKALKLTRI